MISGKFSLVDPDKMEASLTIRMTVGDWKRLREQIGGNYPGWEVHALIDKLVATAEAVFDASEKDLG